ncbi:MAG: hypothetical protein CMC13_07085 [Flavobacteriaceae bacterium]|nr:hypothetical protein [Flavobacteriaceae bacterium]|tara:strand:- start:8533 stop:9282 length:750 start_codon:yes stop_codon:yes gene_type:complete
MIKFFRKIRQNMLSEGKTGKYFKYAFGEIILVMIGILLALQVNNWNNNRIEQNEEKEVIAKLHTDFKENKKVLKDYLIEVNDQMNAQITLMNLVGASKEDLYKHNLDSIFYVSFGSSEMAFADNTIKNIMQSGKLNILKNEIITELLYKWNALSEIRKMRITKLDNWANDKLIPYLIDKMSFKQMDMESDYPWAGHSKVKPDYYPLFQEVAFENYLDNNIWYYQQVKERCLETDKLIDEIIKATKPNTN